MGRVTFSSCSAQVVYSTDGQPVRDREANMVLISYTPPWRENIFISWEVGIVTPAKGNL